MKIEVLHRPAHSLAQVRLESDEAIVAESGAMVGMTPNVQIETRSGGLVAGLKRVLGGETFFRNTFTARNGVGELLLAHGLPGDMAVLDVPASGLVVSAGAYVASTPGATVDTRVGGVRSLFAGEGLFLLDVRAGGPETLVVGAFGGIEPLACDGTLVVDTGHLVAWDASLTFRVTKAARGWVASLLSGEGLVCEMRGAGRVWIQSRSPREYGLSVGRRLPARTS